MCWGDQGSPSYAWKLMQAFTRGCGSRTCHCTWSSLAWQSIRHKLWHWQCGCIQKVTVTLFTLWFKVQVIRPTVLGSGYAIKERKIEHCWLRWLKVWDNFKCFLNCLLRKPIPNEEKPRQIRCYAITMNWQNADALLATTMCTLTGKNKRVHERHFQLASL